MTTGDSSLSSAQFLARRLQWNRQVNQPARAQPVVVLLGPAGSGKTTALKSISADCGGAIVHARFDFDREQPPTTVEVLTRIAFDFSRRWPVRGTPRFLRFTLGLLAVQADLSGQTRDQAKESLRGLIKDVTRNRRAEWLANQVENLANAASKADLVSKALATAVTLALPNLVRALGRLEVNDAARWHADIPRAQQASALDALVELNTEARTDPAEMIGWLTEAFLADVRDSQPRLAKPDPRSDCACPNKQDGRHYHNWLLLLDNLDHPGGTEFIAQLREARERYLRKHPGRHDALVIIGTSGRWELALARGWRPPWNAPPPEPDNLRTVPRCDDADYAHWRAGRETAEHYPVLLEPLTSDETAAMLGIRERSVRVKLAQRATGGLPGALLVLAPLLDKAEPLPGVRDLLRPATAAAGEPWLSRLADLRLAEHLDDIGIDEFVSAAAFATAPWLVPANAHSLVSQPYVGSILTELRTALWVTAPAQGGGTHNYAELHPWVARTLVAALAARDDEAGYPDQFTALLKDQESGDAVRRAYCQLALGRISEVVGYFETTFNAGPHQLWVDRLRLVTRAPDNRPLEQDTYGLYAELVREDSQAQPGRTPVGNVVRRLVIARWLAANPFATPHPRLRTEIRTAYRLLPRDSWEPDVAALDEAAQRDDDELF